MADDAGAPRKGRVLEKHIQTGLLALILSGICAVLGIGFDMATTMAAQAETLSGVNRSIDVLKHDLDRQNARFGDYLTRSEAEVRFRAVDQREEDHARRIDRLELRPGPGG